MNKFLEQHVAEIKLTYSVNVKAQDRVLLNSSAACQDVLRQIWSENIGLLEEFYILLLDRSNRLIGYRMIGLGGVSGVMVDVKIIFACALKCRASGIILAHNHPSGNLTPSEMDIRLTKRIVSAGELLDIKILDHLILSPEGGYYSFTDEGMLAFGVLIS